MIYHLFIKPLWRLVAALFGIDDRREQRAFDAELARYDNSKDAQRARWEAAQAERIARQARGPR